MKKIIQITLVLLFCASATFAQKSVDQLFNQYRDTEGAIKMDLTGNILELLDDELTKGIGSKIDDINIVIMKEGFDFTSDNAKEIKSALRSSEYEELINMRDEGNQIGIYVIEKGDIIKNLFLMINGSGEQNVLVKVSGNLSYDDFKDIDLSGIDGLEQLGKVANKKM